MLKVVSCTAPVFDFSNLPDPKGIPFEGIKDAKIPGRESVAHLIDDFITKSKNNKTIQVCLIKAEWGEGKTDAYDRYISKILKNQHCYSVSTSTLSKRLKKLESETKQSNTAANFLAALFTAIGDDYYSQTSKKNIFQQENVNDPISYLNNTLKKLFENNKKNCYIFLDEFEEILYHDDVKADLISGIKEIINKKFGALCDDGKYAGRVHLFIACTPHAWNTITEDRNFSQVMGSTEQRLVYNLIELPLLSRKDCYYFLADLTKVTYEGKLKKIPISSEGVFETLINISQKNPRALIQLYYQLMSHIDKIDRSNIKCINSSQIFRDLKEIHVSIYGSTTPAIQHEALEQLIGSISQTKDSNKKLFSIFELLTGENKAFQQSEISSRTGIKMSEISNLVNQINELLNQKNNLELALETYITLRKGKTFDNILSRFTVIEQGQDSYLGIGNSRIEIKKLREALTHYVINDDFKNGKYFQDHILVPTHASELSKLLGIELGNAQKLYQIIRNDFDFTKRYYKASINLVENIFPSPNIAKFDFIEDRNKRLELRRKIQKEIGDVRHRDELHSKLKEAVIECFKFDNIKCNHIGNYLNLELTLDTKKIELPVLVETILENITEEKITQLKDLVDKTPVILTLLFYQSLDDAILQNLDKIDEIQRIPLEKTTTEQLLVWRDAIRNHIKINPLSEKTRITDAARDLKINYYLKEVWIRKAIQSGIIIPDLKELGDYGKSDIKSIISTFVSASNLSTEEQWKFYEKLKAIKLFSDSSTFAPADIETKTQWMTWITGLENNAFIDRKENRIRSILSPVECRILELIRKNRNTMGQLEKKFVRLSDATKALKNYYIDTLLQKGKIKEISDTFVIIAKDDTEITSKINNIIKFVNEDYPRNHPVDRLVSQTKERDFKVIRESDYIHMIKNLLKMREALSNDEDEVLRISKLIIAIYDYYMGSFRPIANTAQTAIKSRYDEINELLNQFKLQLDKIIRMYNILCKKPEQHIDLGIIMKEINDKFTHMIENEYRKTYDYDFVSKETENIYKTFSSKSDYKRSPFYFGLSHDMPNHFSLKYYRIAQNIEQFKSYFGPINNTLTKINNHVQKIDEAERTIKAYTASYTFSQNHKISYQLLTLTQKIKPITPTPTNKVARLDEIEEFFSMVASKLGSFMDSISNIITNLKELNSHEETLLNLMFTCRRRIGQFKEFLEDSENISNPSHSTITALKSLGQISDTLSDVTNKYETLSKTTQQPISELTEFVSRVSRTNSEIQQLSKTLNEIERIYANSINDFISEIDSEIHTIKNFINISYKQLSDEKQRILEADGTEFEKFVNKLKQQIIGVSIMKWIEMLDQIKNKKKELMNKVISEINLDKDSANLLSLISEITRGDEFIEPDKLEPKLGKMCIKLFDPSMTKAVQSLYEKGFVRLGIALNKNQEE